MSAEPEVLRISLPHLDIAALAYGPEDAPPVLALHGWLDNAASFERLAPRLPGVRIVALDFAGHGLSGHRPPGSDYYLWDHVADVLAIAEQLGWERFGLLGHSMGAIVSVLLAASAPERVRCLALIDGLLPLHGEELDAAAQLGRALQARRALEGKSRRLFEHPEQAVRARLGAGRLSESATRLLVARGLAAEPGGWRWSSDPRLTLPSPLRFSFEQAAAFARALRCPAHLVLAERGLLVGRERLEALLDSLPLQVTRLPGGHHLHLDDDAGADAVAACFKDHLG